MVEPSALQPDSELFRASLCRGLLAPSNYPEAFDNKPTNLMFAAMSWVAGRWRPIKVAG